MKELKKKWQTQHEFKSQTQNTSKNIGLDGQVTLHCKQFQTTITTKQEITIYHGTTYKGTPCMTETCSWYDTNLRLVLGTLVTGLGTADIFLYGAARPSIVFSSEI